MIARCRVKRSTNKELPDGTTAEHKELIWGYGTGIAVAPYAEYGAVVLADYILPFIEGDITYFRSLFQRTVLALERYPTNLTADAAYDSWYVYEAAARHGGIAAVPLNQHSKTPFARLPDATPLCPIGPPMHPDLPIQPYLRVSCPTLPMPLALSKEHRTELPPRANHQRAKAVSKMPKDVNRELGGKQRASLDRESPRFQSLYVQRTGCERIDARAKELGIERPRMRNGRSVANLNTLIYVIVNVRVLVKAKSINARLLQMHYLRLSNGL